jgi:uncharacterized protein with ParB-like and HNH nuclease domain
MKGMESSIKELFDHQNRVFEIPTYQRSYSWEKEQIEQFIEDIDDCNDTFYLGHFLFESVDTNGSNLYVIDGQQRLTTCIILLSVIRHVLSIRKESGEQVDLDIDDIEHYYLKDTRKNTQKFCTVKNDNNFFLSEIIEYNENHKQESNTVSRKNIRKAKEMFLAEIVKKETNKIVKWALLLQNASITVHTVSDKIKAAQIFAFQNDRGKKLTSLEIVKSYLMLNILLSGQDSDKINQDISFLENDFSNIYLQIVRIKLHEDTVLNYYWRGVSGKGFYSDEVVKGVKEQLQENKKANGVNISDWIKRYVSGLAQAFQTVEKLEKSTDFDMANLNYLNNLALSYPFLIKAYAINAEKKEIERLAKLLENLTFRSLIRGGRADIESRLDWYLVEMENHKLSEHIEWIKNEILNGGWWGYWSDNEMKSRLESGWFYGNRVDNYLLWRYELHISSPDYPVSPKVSYRDFIGNESIEHIAPQTPTNGNPVEAGYGIYDDKENPENGIVSGEWMNSIGNLMLISQKHNSSIGNKPFSQKLQSYGDDNLLNQQKEIVSFVTDKNNPIWDITAIEKRFNEIVKIAMEIWDIKKV